MSTDYAYKDFFKRADNLHYKIKDATDQPDHPAARRLHDQVKALMDDIQQQKKPRTVDDAIKDILNTLEAARNGSQAYMSVHDAVAFHDDFEDFRRDVRQHPHFA